MIANSILAYKKTKVQTAHPVQLVVLLYEEGVIRFLQVAVEALEVGDLERAHGWLVRAQDVVVELQSTLNFDAGPIAGELNNLYGVLHHMLVLANVRKDSALAREVLGHF